MAHIPAYPYNRQHAHAHLYASFGGAKYLTFPPPRPRRKLGHRSPHPPHIPARTSPRMRTRKVTLELERPLVGLKTWKVGSCMVTLRREQRAPAPGWPLTRAWPPRRRQAAPAPARRPTLPPPAEAAVQAAPPTPPNPPAGMVRRPVAGAPSTCRTVLPPGPLPPWRCCRAYTWAPAMWGASQTGPGAGRGGIGPVGSSTSKGPARWQLGLRLIRPPSLRHPARRPPPRRPPPRRPPRPGVRRLPTPPPLPPAPTARARTSHPLQRWERRRGAAPPALRGCVPRRRAEMDGSPTRAGWAPSNRPQTGRCRGRRATESRAPGPGGGGGLRDTGKGWRAARGGCAVCSQLLFTAFPHSVPPQGRPFRAFQGAFPALASHPGPPHLETIRVHGGDGLDAQPPRGWRRRGAHAAREDDFAAPPVLLPSGGAPCPSRVLASPPTAIASLSAVCSLALDRLIVARSSTGAVTTENRTAKSSDANVV
eukprot:scaffold26075_cov86-Isochrysis_galbana.AAC.1